MVCRSTLDLRVDSFSGSDLATEVVEAGVVVFFLCLRNSMKMSKSGTSAVLSV